MKLFLFHLQYSLFQCIFVCFINSRKPCVHGTCSYMREHAREITIYNSNNFTNSNMDVDLWVKFHFTKLRVYLDFFQLRV